MYEYRCRIFDVESANHLRLDIDVGFGGHVTTTVRLAGISLREPNSPVVRFVDQWIEDHGGRHSDFLVRTIKEVGTGEYLATILDEHDSRSLNDAIAEALYFTAAAGK